MAILFRQITKGLLLRAQSSDPSDNLAGSLWYNSTDNTLSCYLDGAVRDVVTHSQTQTISGKTLTSPTINTAAIANAASFSLSASSPSLDIKDSDASDGDINAQILVAATDTGSGTEDVDITIKQQIAGTLTSVMTFDADGAILMGRSTYNATATLSDGANISWDVTASPMAKVTLGGNRTLDDPSNMVDGAVYTLRVIQDGTGSRTLAYGSAYLFPGGTAPTLSTGAGAVDYLTFVSDGTNMYGVFQGNFS